MTDKELNIEIAKLCGIKPRKYWRYFTDAERTSGPFRIATKVQAELNRAAELQFYKEFNSGQDWSIGEVEEYDEYFEPDYCNSRDEIYDEIMEKPFSWKCNFVKILQSVMGALNGGQIRADWLVFASTRHLCEAFVQTYKEMKNSEVLAVEYPCDFTNKGN